MNTQLGQKKIALVTDSSKGLGLGIARSLHAEGCHGTLCARSEVELNAAAEKLRSGPGSGKVLSVVTDLKKDEDRARAVERTVDEHGGLDILVNNAGTVGDGGTLDDTPLDAWRSLFELNLFAVVDLCRRVVPHMREQGWGRIVNVSSENGTQPYPDMIHYSASKGALDNFTKALSKAVADDGILVNTVSPAFIMTPLVEEMMDQMAEEQGVSRDEAVERFLAQHRPHIELGRPGRIDEVGPVVAFLASEQASFINGTDVRVDGGSVAAI